MKYFKIFAVVLSLLVLWFFTSKYWCIWVDLLLVSTPRNIDVSSIKFSPSGLEINKFLIESKEEINLFIDSTNQLVIKSRVQSLSLGEATELEDSEPHWRVYLINPRAGDLITFTETHSLLFWKEPFRSNFMTGQTADRYRYRYYQLYWKKSSGETMSINWKYIQEYWSGTGWSKGNTERDSETGITVFKINDRKSLTRAN